MTSFDADKERELLIKAQKGDMMARKELHKEYRRMINNIIYKHYSNSPQPISAIRLQAIKIFDEHIDKWNPTMENRPSTYFYNVIRDKLQRYVNEYANPVRITEQHAFNVGKYLDSVDELTQEFGRTPTDVELQRHMSTKYPSYNFSLKNIKRLKDNVRTSVSGSSPVGRQEEGTPLLMSDLAFVDNETDIMDEYLTGIKIQELVTKVNMLPEPQKTILLHHYGINGYPKLSLRELSTKFGLNKYRVQAHIKDGIERLKQ